MQWPENPRSRFRRALSWLTIVALLASLFTMIAEMWRPELMTLREQTKSVAWSLAAINSGALGDWPARYAHGLAGILRLVLLVVSGMVIALTLFSLTGRIAPPVLLLGIVLPLTLALLLWQLVRREAWAGQRAGR